MSILARNLKDATAANGEIRAGGTDVSPRRRLGVSAGDLIDISRIPDLESVVASNSGAEIGALVTIDSVARHPDLLRLYPGLAMAAGSLATPQIRKAASMGGALLQRTRCWYYRHEEFDCFKKGGDSCPAREGNHEYGVCFDLGGCVFPHPSTLGMAMMVYDATLTINQNKKMGIAELYGTDASQTDHLLQPGEILTSITLPPPLPQEKSAYFRSIGRARAEWPLVEVSVRYLENQGKIAQAAVAIGGVANVPLLLPKVADFLNGKTPNETTFQQAGELAAEKANPLPMTKYKIEMVKATVFETLRRADEGVWGGEG